MAQLKDLQGFMPKAANLKGSLFEPWTGGTSHDEAGETKQLLSGISSNEAMGQTT